MSDAVLHAAPGESASRTAWAMPLIPVAVSGFLLSAMTSLRVQGDLPSPPEGTLAGGVVALYRLFGFEPLFMVCVLMLTWSSIWFLTGRVERPLSRLARIGALGLSLAILVNLRVDGALPSGGGELGALLASRLASVISPAISIFAVAVAAVAALLLATDFFFYGHFERLGARRLGAREVGAPEPEVDVAEQQQLESLELQSPALGTAGPVAPSVDPDAGTLAAGDAPTGEVTEGQDASANAESEDFREVEEGAEDARRDSLGGEVWAIEEELSAVTLLGPRSRVSERSEDETESDGAPAGDEPVTRTVHGDDLDSGSAPAIEEPTAETWEDAPEPSVEAEFADAADGGTVEASADETAEGELAFQLESSSQASSVDQAVQDAPPEEAGGEPVEAPVAASADLATPDEVEADDAPVVEDDAPVVKDDAPVDEGEEPFEERAEDVEPIVELTPAPRVVREPAGPNLDPELVEEAVDLVVSYRRASATFLRRRLRVEEDEAMALLQILAERGIIDCEVGATQGRIRGG